MRRLEAELAATQLSPPASDDMMETLQRILSLLPNGTEADLDVIDSMSSRFAQREAEARARGDTEKAERFSAFRQAFARSGQAASAAATASGQSGPAPAPTTAPPAPSHPAASATTPEPAVDLSTGDIHVQPKPESRSPAPVSAATMTVLLKRANDNLAEGHVWTARLLFQRVAQSGNSAAFVGLAKTYDPVFLAKLGTRGFKPDPQQAAEWYRKAIEVGDEAAAAALSQLVRWKLEHGDDALAEMTSGPHSDAVAPNAPDKPKPTRNAAPVLYQNQRGAVLLNAPDTSKPVRNVAPKSTQPRPEQAREVPQEAPNPNPSPIMISVRFAANTPSAEDDAKQVVTRLGSRFERADTQAETDVPQKAIIRFFSPQDHDAARTVGEMLAKMGYAWWIDNNAKQSSPDAPHIIEVWLPPR